MSVPNSRVIYGPGADVLDILHRRMPTAARAKLDGLFIDAIGLIQANVSNILYFADIAQKAAAVFPVELNGSCPQHIITLALLGDIAAVDAAMDAIDLTLKSSNSAHNN